MRALLFNCTLKPSGEESNTDGLLGRVSDELKRLGADCELLRPVDFNIKPGTSSAMGEGDDWPLLLSKLQACDIFILGTPVWLGWHSSVAQRVLERMDAVFHEDELHDPATGQYYTYNKVAGMVVTGNEDGAHACVARLSYALGEMGFSLPPTANAYWVGMAGPGESYLKAGGRTYEYSNNMALTLANNLHYFADLLKEHPIPTDLKALTVRARQMSAASDAKS